MNIKRLCSFFLVLLITAGLFCAPLSASASVIVENGMMKVLPGHPRAASPEYSKAWLDNVVIRDSTTAIASARLVPNGDYKYRLTYDEFINEVGNYSILNLIDEDTVSSAYGQIINILYYMVTALGMTKDIESMRAYVRSCGITLPALRTSEDDIKVTVIYAAIKYDAVYTLYNKKVSFPQGISLDNAICIVIAELTGVFLPSGVDTLGGVAINSLKTYISQFDFVPVSKNPSNEEVFYWSKVLTAASNNYEVPFDAFDKVTDTEKEYVDYAYFASILNKAYDVKIDPVNLIVANNNKEKNSVAKVILRTMLDESEVDYSIDADCETLFNLACKNGKFPLDEDFYSDIFNYDLYIANDCTKIWFTPFALAEQLGGFNACLSMTLAGNKISPSQTVAYSIDPSKSTDKIELTVTYSDTLNPTETVTYTFNVIRKSASETKNSNAQNSVVAEIQNAINSAIPADNKTANGIVDNIMGNIDAALSTTAASNSNSGSGVLTTYATDNTSASSGGYNSSPEKASSGVDFSYLAELMSETFENDSQASKALSDYSSLTATTESRSFVQKTVETIKQNPEVAAAPTGIIALGGLAGYIWTKRKKTLEKIHFSDEKPDEENSNDEKPDEENWFED